MYNEYLIPIALLTMRLWLGGILIAQAYDKLFNIGIQNVSQVIEFKISAFKLSPSFYKAFAAITSLLEFIGGILLVLGFLSVFAYSAIALDIVLISLAFSLTTPMWDMRHVFPRFIILIVLMFAGTQQDWFSLDYFIHLKMH